MSWENILKSLEEQIKQEVKKLEANKVFDIEYVGKSEISDWNATYFDFKMTFDISEYKFNPNLNHGSPPNKNITWDLSILIYDGLHTNLQIHGGDGLPNVWAWIRHHNIRFKGDNAMKKLFEHLGEHLLDMYLEIRQVFVK